MNKVILLGHVGKEPVVRYAASGAAVLNFSVATTRSYKGKDGSFEKKTQWHNVVAFGKQAEYYASNVHAGTKVFIDGELNHSKYENKEGVTVYKTDVLANTVETFTEKSEKTNNFVKQTKPAQQDFTSEEIPF